MAAIKAGQGAQGTVPPLFLAAVLMMVAPTTWAGDPAGRTVGQPGDTQAQLWAAGCAACHGTDGKGVGGFPALAGRDAQELLALLLKQRAGQADSTIMHQHARGFSEAELARIAAVFAARPKP